MHYKLNKKNWTILRKGQYALLKEFFSQKPDDLSVLDLGSGPSPFRDLFARFRLTSVDWEQQEIVDRVFDLNMTLSFKDSSFDFVTSTNTFEHLYTNTAWEESYRVLVDGGWLVGSTPFLLAVHQAPYDYYRFTKFALEKKLQDIGYRNIRVEEIGGAYDVVWHTTRQMFMKAFDQNFLLSKVSWNILKFYWFIFGRFFASIKNKNMCLGYMFYAQK